MGFEYDVTELRLFIDSSSKSLNAIFLHNGNVFLMKSTNISIDHLLSAVNSKEHKSLICGDVLVVRLFLRL